MDNMVTILKTDKKGNLIERTVYNEKPIPNEILDEIAFIIKHHSKRIGAEKRGNK